MSKQEILIESSDTEFLVKLIKFIESQPKQEGEPKTKITMLEEGSAEALRKILEAVRDIDDIRRANFDRLKQSLRTKVEKGLQEEIVD